MKIVQASIRSTRIPTVRQHRMAIGTTSHQENVIVRLIAEDGTIGLGEAPHMVGHSQLGETPESVRSVLITRLIPAIAGIEVLNPTAISAAMDARVPGNERAKGAVMMAAYDMAARTLGVPVSVLLGGTVRTNIPLSWSLPIIELERAIEEARTMHSRGFRIFKIKAGRQDPTDDVALASKVREEFGDEIRLRVDANQAYSVKEALGALKSLEPFNIEFLEQPVHRENHDGMRWLCRYSNTSIPIMADEGAKTLHDISRICRERSADYLSIYIIGCGGIDKSRRIADIAQTFGMRGYVGGALESGIGAAAGLHLAASSQAIDLGCELHGQFLLEADLAAAPPKFKDGSLEVSNAPGLGIELDDDVASRYQVGEIEHIDLPTRAYDGD